MSSTYRGARLGTQFGPYELRSLIGVGGMGEVYRAHDTIKGRMVALKVLRTELAADPSFQERFRRESRMAARLQEPHVIPVHDFGDIRGVLFIDMRLVDGGSLKDLLRAQGALEPMRAAKITAQVAAALDAAHAEGLVHRDVKPENVLLTSDDFAYLVDFGIAHAGGDASVTASGSLVGSCAYMATERFTDGRVGPQADVYSLACMLYECLTGRPPFDHEELQQLMGAHIFMPPPRPSIMRRGIGRAFDDVIARGMAKDPAARFSSAGELARAATEAASMARGRFPSWFTRAQAQAQARRRTRGRSRRSTPIRMTPATAHTRRLHLRLRGRAAAVCRWSSLRRRWCCWPSPGCWRRYRFSAAPTTLRGAKRLRPQRRSRRSRPLLQRRRRRCHVPCRAPTG